MLSKFTLIYKTLLQEYAQFGTLLRYVCDVWGKCETAPGQIGTMHAGRAVDPGITGAETRKGRNACAPGTGSVGRRGVATPGVSTCNVHAPPPRKSKRNHAVLRDVSREFTSQEKRARERSFRELITAAKTPHRANF